MPPLEGIRIVRSSIHGYGGVTTQRYFQGETLCHGDGVLYPQDAEFDDTYSLILPAEDAPDGKPLFWDLTCQTRWFNHSCDPNTEVMARWDPDTQTVRAWWIALRDIAVGEEITYDYGFVAEVAEPCACGSPRCRGVIVDDDPENLAQLPEHLRRLLRAPAPAAS